MRHLLRKKTATANLFNRGLALILAIVLAVCVFTLQGHSGLNLADEGFLWYGVQQTASGAVPLRDFQSYDPGRYYWCAIGAQVFGKGLVALRLSEAVAQALGLWAGLLAASRLTRDWKVLGCIGVMLTLWMFPSHKVFDHTVLLLSVLIAVRLVERPSARRVFATGCFVGFCTFFGRNHALYNLAATGGLLLLLYWKARAEVPASRILLWCAGLVIGAIPILLMLLAVPGFGAAYLESIISIFRNGANLGMPIPWLWRVSTSGDLWMVSSNVVLGFFLILIPIFYLFAIGSSLRMSAEDLKKNALFVACGFVGLPYMHHAFARADISHLAQSIHPFTLGVCAAISWSGLSTSVLWPVLIALSAIAFVGGGSQNPLVQRTRDRVPWVRYNLGGKVFVPARAAKLYDCLRRFTAEHLGVQETLLIAPYTPGLYPVLKRPSPLWELFFFFPATSEQQKQAIDLLSTRHVNWALIADTTLDRRNDLRFSSTHRILWQYLIEHFEPVKISCLPKGMTMLHRKERLSKEGSGPK